MTKEINDMIELITSLDTNTKILVGFNEAILGYEIGNRETRVAYSVNHIIKKLEKGGMTFLEAMEEFDRNISKKFDGVGRPVFIYSNNKNL